MEPCGDDDLDLLRWIAEEGLVSEEEPVQLSRRPLIAPARSCSRTKALSCTSASSTPRRASDVPPSG